MTSIFAQLNGSKAHPILCLIREIIRRLVVRARITALEKFKREVRGKRGRKEGIK